MNYKVKRLTIVIFALCLLAYQRVYLAVGKPMRQDPTTTPTFLPPIKIKVDVNRLDENLECPDTYIPCTLGDRAWGCVHDPNGMHTFTYLTQPISISVSNEYLLNVIPQEEDVTIYPQQALDAQAIAARTFAYKWTRFNNRMTNCVSEYNGQLYTPYTFEDGLSAVTNVPPNITEMPCASTNLSLAQRKVCDAVASNYYLSEAGKGPELSTTIRFTHGDN